MITGFGRTGNYWGSQTFDLKPDIMVCAKMLSASYLPLAAVMVSEEIYQAIADGSDAVGTFGHGFTYGGHPVACAVALETLAIYDERDIVGHVRDVAPYFQSRLREAFAGHPLVGEVRGVGLVAGIELVRDKATKEPFERSMGVAAHAVSRAQHHRMISRAVGDTLCVSPPLIVTREVIDEIVRRLSLSLDETAEHAQGAGGGMTLGPGRRVGQGRPCIALGPPPESPANGPNNNLSDQEPAYLLHDGGHPTEGGTRSSGGNHSA